MRGYSRESGSGSLLLYLRYPRHFFFIEGRCTSLMGALMYTERVFFFCEVNAMVVSQPVVLQLLRWYTSFLELERRSARASPCLPSQKKKKKIVSCFFAFKHVHSAVIGSLFFFFFFFFCSGIFTWIYAPFRGFSSSGSGNRALNCRHWKTE